MRTATVKQSYHYMKNGKKLKTLQRVVQYKKVQWLKQTRPERLERLAKSLELHPPQLHQLLRYDSKKGLPALAP